MRGVKIDPEHGTIEEVDYSGDYKDIYKMLDIDTFTVVDLDNNNTLFVDDEGLLKDPEFFFTIDDGQPLAGKGLVLATDKEGETVATNLTIEDLTARIKFKRLKLLDIATFQKETDEGFVIGSFPVFKDR